MGTIVISLVSGILVEWFQFVITIVVVDILSLPESI